MQLRDLRSFLHAQPRALSLNKTGMSTTLSRNEYDACNCGVSAVFTQTAHEESAGPAQQWRRPPFQWTATEESHGFLNNQYHRRLHLRATPEIDDLDTRGQCMWRCTTTGKSKPVQSCTWKISTVICTSLQQNRLHCAYLSL